MYTDEFVLRDNTKSTCCPLQLMFLRIKNVPQYCMNLNLNVKCVVVYLLLLASDQPLRAELEVLLPAVWHGHLWHRIRGGAPPNQETLLGNL